MSQKLDFWLLKNWGAGRKKRGLTVTGVAQIEAGPKVLIYKLILDAKISVLSIENKLKTLGNKCPLDQGGLISRWLINSKF